jgi:endonuclease G
MRQAALIFSFIGAWGVACSAEPTGGNGGATGSGASGGQGGSAATGTGGATAGGTAGASGNGGGSGGSDAGAAGTTGGSPTGGGGVGTGGGGSSGASGATGGGGSTGGSGGSNGAAGTGGAAGKAGSGGTPDAGSSGTPDAGAPVDAQPDRSTLDIAGDACTSMGPPNVELGTPTDSDPSDDVIVDHTYYLLSYNPTQYDPNWVSWHFGADDIGSTARQDNFAADSLLPSMYYRVKATDYQGSGYDRGHLSPSADNTASVMQNATSFLMTNMLPQYHELNAGPWAGLETFERSLALTDQKQVYIIAGPIFDAAPAKIGPGVAVPKSCFKILVALDTGQGPCEVTSNTPIYAVIMPNEKTTSGTPWGDYATSIDAIEAATGYDFLSGVPFNVQTVIESRVTRAPSD